MQPVYCEFSLRHAGFFRISIMSSFKIKRIISFFSFSIYILFCFLCSKCVQLSKVKILLAYKHGYITHIYIYRSAFASRCHTPEVDDPPTCRRWVVHLSTRVPLHSLQIKFKEYKRYKTTEKRETIKKKKNH